MIPPFDCMIRTGASELASLTRRTSESVYDFTMGPRQAFTTVVLVRSYSRISGSTSDGQGDEYSRQHPTQFLANGPLMVGIAVRMEQTHRHGFRLFLKYDVDRSVEGVHVERNQDFSVRADPLRHLQPQVAVHQGLRGSVEQAVQGRHAHPPQFKDIAEALRRYQGRLRALVLEDGVGCDRRPVGRFLR